MRSLPCRPRLLVCHDMAGGYGADAPVQGCADCGAFRLLHWHAVDVFVYFSHHLVTLPPPGWVAAGHCHGVPVRCGGRFLKLGQGAGVCACRPNLHGRGAALVMPSYRARCEAAPRRRAMRQSWQRPAGATCHTHSASTYACRTVLCCLGEHLVSRGRVLVVAS